MDEAQRGAKALEASNFPAAIDHYTRALVINPHATDYYIKRSTAYSRLKRADGGPNGTAALHDAEMAVALGLQRARRELILAGQMRRGIALYQLERFGDADFVFKLLREKMGPPGSEKKDQNAMESAMAASAGGGAKDSSSNELQIWEMKIKARMTSLAPEDEKAAVTVKEYPDLKVPDQDTLKKQYQAQLAEGGKPSTSSSSPATATKAPVDGDKGKTVDNATTTTQAAQPPQPAKAPQGPVASTVRHEWYQSSDKVVVTLYAKGVPKDKAEIDIQERSLSVSFPLASGSDYSFNLDPLFAPVDTSASKSSVMSTKLEIVLIKQQPGLKWGGLEGTQSIAKDTDNPAAPTSSVQAPAKAPAAAPSYPTSAKGGVKDWDKVASSLNKKEKKKKKKDGASGEEEEEDEGAQSDDSDYGSGDPVDSFFKKLYANADPDTRRAMVKSYYESEGTSLSTNWSSVKDGKVEVRPPSDD